MDTVRIVSKEAFNTFVQRLAADTVVVAPVKGEDDEFTYAEVQDASALDVEGYTPTLNPPKKYFFPAEEVLFRFQTPSDQPVHSGAEVEVTPEVQSRDTVLLGVRPCDVRAIRLMDRAFEDTYEDENYLRKRDRAIIIGLNCLQPCDEHAFCAAMGSLEAPEGYDLMLTDMGESWAVTVGTERGRQLLDECGDVREVTRGEKEQLERIRERRDADFEPVRGRLDFPGEEIPDVLGRGEDSPVWREYGKRCLGCGRCNLVCPTCFCFDVQDEVSVDLAAGERKRKWDGCTLLEFARVAGGENFREDRSDRLRHVFYHKGKYAHERYGELFCTGCGRCTRTCLAGIDHPEVYNAVRRRPRGADS